jgi:hypothetical protein
MKKMLVNLKQKSTLRRILLGALFLSVIAVTGCPYEAKFPIAPAGENIDQGLVGKWKKTSGTTKNYWDIKKKSNSQYEIVDYTWNSSKKKYTTKNYAAYFTTVKGQKFLNIEHRKGAYIFYRLGASGSRYYADPITGNIRTKLNSSAELKSFIEQYSHLGFFYEKREEFYKY